MKKKVQLLPNVMTAFGLSCGLFVIFKMNMIAPGEASPRILLATAGILILAAIADLLDGALARAMKAESEFGGIFDSLADAISFGVGPSVIMLKSLSIVPGTELSFLLTTAAMVYTLCGVLRLVRYNLTSLQIKGDDNLEEASKKNFTGLPITAAAAAAVSGNLFLFSHELRSVMDFSMQTKAWILFFQMILLGYFMVSRWKFPSLKSLHVRVSSFQIVFLTVLLAVFIFYGILYHFSVVFFCLSWGYVVAAWILSIIRLLSGKSSKTLEDFEPEPEELE